MALAAHFLVYTSVLPWVHTSHPSSVDTGPFAHLGVAPSHDADGSLPTAIITAEASTAHGDEDLCLACLYSAQPRSLTAPDDLVATILAQSQEKIRRRVDTAGRFAVRTLSAPRAPPFSAVS